jgi:hypothetical protein
MVPPAQLLLAHWLFMVQDWPLSRRHVPMPLHVLLPPHVLSSM